MRTSQTCSSAIGKWLVDTNLSAALIGRQSGGRYATDTSRSRTFFAVTYGVAEARTSLPSAGTATMRILPLMRRGSFSRSPLRLNVSAARASDPRASADVCLFDDNHSGDHALRLARALDGAPEAAHGEQGGLIAQARVARSTLVRLGNRRTEPLKQPGRSPRPTTLTSASPALAAYTNLGAEPRACDVIFNRLDRHTDALGGLRLRESGSQKPKNRLVGIGAGKCMRVNGIHDGAWRRSCRFERG